MEAVVGKSIRWGLVGAVGLMLFYWVVLSFANSFDHAVEQWQRWWYWIGLLVGGFGSQVGLYSYVRLMVRERKMRGAGKKVAVTGGVSAGAMVACCAHHAVDVLPILGLSAAALFLAEYQQFFMTVGVVGNVIGIVYMLEIIKKHALYNEGSGLGWLAQYDITQLRRWTVVGSGAVLVFILMETGKTDGLPQAVQSEELMIKTDEKIVDYAQNVVQPSLPSRTNNSGGLTVKVTPVSFAINKSVKFAVQLNTHQGDLAFNLAEQSFLIDDRGRKYTATQWQGGTGGHHLSGQLVFPPIDNAATEMKLVIRDVYEVEERTFEWVL